MAPFCTELLDKGVGGGGEAARRHTSRGQWPRPLRQQAGGPLGRAGHFFPVGWAPVTSCTGRVSLSRSYAPASPTLCTVPQVRQDGQTLASTRCLSQEPRKAPSSRRTELKMLVNLERGRHDILIFTNFQLKFSSFFNWECKKN